MKPLVAALSRLSPALASELDGWLTSADDFGAPAEPLAERLAPHLRAPVSGLDAPGLVLAAAALCGAPRALTTLDALIADQVRRAVTPLARGDTAFIDETAQLVRERLLVASPPRLAEYAGQGPLAAWVRAVAVRTALNARRPHAREDLVDEVPDAPLADPDPELQLLRARYRDAFSKAFTAATATLEPRQRTVLRLTAIDGLSLAAVGTMYGKDASTISRWVATAREALLAATRQHLVATFGLRDSELASVMRAADSELHLSIARLLESAGD